MPWRDDDLCSSTNVAGCTYCGVCVLRLLGRLPPPGKEETDDDLPQNLIRWLVSRQTLYLQEEDDLPMAAEDVPEPAPEEKPPSFQVQNAFPVSAIDTAKGPNISMDVQMDDLKCAGFNGRCNKVADTCYAFWVGGSLGVSFHMILISTAQTVI